MTVIQSLACDDVGPLHYGNPMGAACDLWWVICDEDLGLEAVCDHVAFDRVQRGLQLVNINVREGKAREPLEDADVKLLPHGVSIGSFSLANVSFAR